MDHSSRLFAKARWDRQRASWLCWRERERERKKAHGQGWGVRERLINFLKVLKIRSRFGLTPAPPTEPDELFKVLNSAETMDSGWNGRMFFVYLPLFFQYLISQKDPWNAYLFRDYVLSTATELDFPSKSNNWKDIMSKLSILSEFWDYLKVRKKWWLAPIIFFLALFGALIVLTEGSAIAPFIYTLF